jgi:hypothetical protein
MVTLTLNPFAVNIDMTTQNGSKLYKQATAGTTKKYDLNNNPTNAEDFKREVIQASQDFCWGRVCHEAAVEWAPDPANANNMIATRYVDIMTEFNQISKDEIRVSSGTGFGCTFQADDKTHDFIITDSDNDDLNQRRLKSVMMGQWLIKSLSDKGAKELQNDQALYKYKNTDGTIINDGAMILLIILKKIMPSTKVGVSHKKNLLMNMNPANHDNDAGKMITEMQNLKVSIESESKKEYDDFMLHLFNACTKSNNEAFRKYSMDLKSDWETDRSSTTDSEFIDMLHTKWNNESLQCTNQSTQKKPSSEKAQFLAMFTALTSNIQALSQQVQTIQKGNNHNKPGGSSAGSLNSHRNIEEWRKTKTLGDETIKDGKHFYWCPQHQDGKGLYVTHHPQDHGKHPKEWTYTNRAKQPSEQGFNAPSSKLQVSDKMKAALTSTGVNDEAVQSLLESLQSGQGDFW